MDGSDMVRQLRELADLQAQGTLTPEEFAAAKARLLRASADPPPPASSDTAPRGHSNPGGDIQQNTAAAAAAQPAPPGPGRPEPPNGPAGPTLARPSPSASGPSGSGGEIPFTPPRFGRGPEWSSVSISRMVTATSRSGPATATLVGGAVAFLSFLILPMASAPFLGSITGAGLASHASDYGVLGWLWLVLIASGVITGLGAWQRFASELAAQVCRRGSVAALTLACVTVLIYLIVFASIQNAITSHGGSLVSISAADILGAGFWFVLLGAIVAAAGAIAQLRHLAGQRP